ncbi:MAG: GNAT family N-acetyltransferase [Chitinivibrionales bacterium]|nr:GNAT family N-acetyltransferase [Chitinivibrionales bacterium]
MEHKDDVYALVNMETSHLKELYAWRLAEQHFECFTCHPVNPVGSFDEFKERMEKNFTDASIIEKVLVRTSDGVLVGKIRGFKFNPRNHSFEIGYFLPLERRAQGVGARMLRLFLQDLFNDARYGVHKVYASTSAHNAPSIGLLKKFGFHLDGMLREHHWIEDRTYDQHIYSLLRREWENEASCDSRATSRI